MNAASSSGIFVWPTHHPSFHEGSPELSFSLSGPGNPSLALRESDEPPNIPLLQLPCLFPLCRRKK